MANTRFSTSGYLDLIRMAKSRNYEFITFSQLSSAADGRLCLLRHDVDVSVSLALEMARLEAEQGIYSTYFMMLRSPVYNLLSRANYIALGKIVELGHEIGLHFDAAHPQVDSDSLPDLVQEEANLLGRICKSKISAVSFHQPTQDIVEADIDIRGIVNTYNKQQLAGWYYISDSNREWRNLDALSLFQQALHENVQLLIHPMWWICDEPSTKSVWDRALQLQFEATQEQLLATERAYGAPRYFRIES